MSHRRSSYPRSSSGPGNLGNCYVQIGEVEKAVAATQEALRLNPNSARFHANQAYHLTLLNRYAEAEQVLQRALAQKLDSTIIREKLHALAFIKGDTKAIQEQIAWASGKPDEYSAMDWQVATASFAGEWRKSQEHLRRATDLALRVEAKENASVYSGWQAVSAAWLGQFAQAVTLAEAALKIEHNRDALATATFALALAGQAAKVQPLIHELEEKYPKGTLVNQALLPEIKAALALHKGDAQAALDLLEPARRLEPTDNFWQQTLRATAYLKLGKGAEAAAEARRVIDHRGEGPRSLLWPLAHLNLARASSMQGDTAQARQMYEEFFKLWQNADADLPILIQAQREYAKLK